MIYKIKDLNKLFTDETAKLIEKGYVFNPATMAGHQGEIAKVDLVSPDRKQVARVIMDRGRDKDFHDTITISTRLYPVTDECDINSLNGWCTLWNSNGTEYSKQVYYVIPNHAYEHKSFTDLTTIEQISRIQIKRSAARPKQWTGCKTTNIRTLAAKKAVLPFVQRQPRCKSYKIDNIDFIQKAYNTYDKKITYTVKAKNHWFELH